MNKQPLIIYELTPRTCFKLTIEKIDSKGRMYPCHSKRPIPMDKITTSKDNQIFYYGNRYFGDKNLMDEIIHEEVQAKIAALPSSEEVVNFWKEFYRRNPDD